MSFIYLLTSKFGYDDRRAELPSRSSRMLSMLRFTPITACELKLYCRCRRPTDTNLWNKLSASIVEKPFIFSRCRDSFCSPKFKIICSTTELLSFLDPLPSRCMYSAFSVRLFFCYGRNLYVGTAGLIMLLELTEDWDCRKWKAFNWRSILWQNDSVSHETVYISLQLKVTEISEMIYRWVLWWRT